MREKLTSNLGLKIASVLLAIVLWFLVVNAVDPVVTNNVNNIKVEVRNPEAITDQGKVYEGLENQTVSISLDAKKTDWSAISADDFCAYVDLEYSYGVDEKNQAVQVQIEVVDNRSIIDESTIRFRSDDVLYFTTENVLTREMEVEVEEEGELSETYRLSGSEVTPATVEVRAPESVMAMVSRVVVRLDRSELNSDNTEITATPIVLDANGDAILSDQLSLSVDEVTISASLMLTKSVPINCEGVTGTPADGYRYSDISIEPDSITVVGSRTALADFTHILIPASELDISGASGNVTRNIQLTLPEGITALDGMDTVAVTVHIEELQTRTYRIPVDQVAFANQNPNYEYKVSGASVPVTLTGLQEDLDVLMADQLVAMIDVSGLEPGTYSREVQIQLDSGYTLNGPVTAVVEVRDPSVPEETEPETSSEDEGTSGSGSAGTDETSSEEES